MNRRYSLFLGGILATNMALAAEPVSVGNRVYVKSSSAKQAAFHKLSEQEQHLVYHLTRAGDHGRMIALYQSHRHALRMYALFQTALADENVEQTKKLFDNSEAFEEFVRYAAIFEEKLGPYNGANHKYILRKVTNEQIDSLFDTYSKRTIPTVRKEIAKLLIEPHYEVLQQPASETGDGLILTGGNLYQKGITHEEVNAAIKDKSLSVQTNSRVYKKPSGSLAESRFYVNDRALPSGVTAELKAIVHELEQAKRYALHAQQVEQIEHLIAYFTTGELEHFSKFNLAWLQLPTTNVDFMGGPVETYGDYRNVMGNWEWYVLLVDPEITKISRAIAQHAADFEQQMPYEDKLKKRFASDYAPQALMASYFQESLSGMRTLGFNLPNDERMRSEKGFKNVIKVDFSGETQSNQETLMEFLREFAPSAQVDFIAAHYEKALRLKVLLHEIIGHGSGTFDPESYSDGADPLEALGKLGSALEEQRADLAALVFADSPILTQVGFFADETEAATVKKALYESYLVNFYQRFTKKRTFDQAHTRGQLLFIKKALEAGAIGFIAKDGSSGISEQSQVLTVKDVNLCQQVARQLLSELQTIKAYRKKEELTTLMATYAPLGELNASWVQAAIKRAEPLRFYQETVEERFEIKQVDANSFEIEPIKSFAKIAQG